MRACCCSCAVLTLQAMRARIGELGGGEAVVQAMGSFSADAQLQQSGASPGIVYNIIVTRGSAILHPSSFGPNEPSRPANGSRRWASRPGTGHCEEQVWQTFTSPDSAIV